MFLLKIENLTFGQNQMKIMVIWLFKSFKVWFTIYMSLRTQLVVLIEEGEEGEESGNA